MTGVSTHPGDFEMERDQALDLAFSIAELVDRQLKGTRLSNWPEFDSVFLAARIIEAASDTIAGHFWAGAYAEDNPSPEEAAEFLELLKPAIARV